jgi:hypothetical protein
LVSTSSCANRKDNSSPSNSKILAKVGQVKITEQQVDIRMQSSEFSDTNKDYSKTDVLNKLIDEQLLLIKARELNITMTDDEVRDTYKMMLEAMSSTQVNIETDANKLDKKAIEGLREFFIIGRTKVVLGTDIDDVLSQLKKEVKIEYY